MLPAKTEATGQVDKQRGSMNTSLVKCPLKSIAAAIQFHPCHLTDLTLSTNSEAWLCSTPITNSIALKAESSQRQHAAHAKN